MKAWGFEPSTLAFEWIKTWPSATVITLDGEGLFTGNGYGTRSNGEACFRGIKGSPLRLAPDVHPVVLAPVGEHSAKPEEVRRRIERLYGGPYLELYGRRPVTGWTVWGNEIPRADFPPYDAQDDIGNSVAEGFRAVRARVGDAGEVGRAGTERISRSARFPATRAYDGRGRAMSKLSVRVENFKPLRSNTLFGFVAIEALVTAFPDAFDDGGRA